MFFIKKYSQKEDVKVLAVKYFLLLLFFPLSVKAHTLVGMIGFYDGIFHPVLGLDHFLAMVSVGIISALIGRRAIWLVPMIFVCSMIVGGLFGMIVEIDKSLRDQALDLSQIDSYNFFADYVTYAIEIGITVGQNFITLKKIMDIYLV